MDQAVVIQYPHHKKRGAVFNRPKYRDGKHATSVKVYTIAQESCYLLVFGVPSIGVQDDLRRRFSNYGNIDDFKVLDDYPNIEAFTDVFLIKFDKVDGARWAKHSLDDHTFYGGALHICYAPEWETVAETRLKMHIRRRQVLKRCAIYDDHNSVVRDKIASGSSLESLLLENSNTSEVEVLPSHFTHGCLNRRSKFISSETRLTATTTTTIRDNTSNELRQSNSNELYFSNCGTTSMINIKNIASTSAQLISQSSEFIDHASSTLINKPCNTVGQATSETLLYPSQQAESIEGAAIDNLDSQSRKRNWCNQNSVIKKPRGRVVLRGTGAFRISVAQSCVQQTFDKAVCHTVPSRSVYNVKQRFLPRQVLLSAVIHRPIQSFDAKNNSNIPVVKFSNISTTNL